MAYKLGKEERRDIVDEICNDMNENAFVLDVQVITDASSGAEAAACTTDDGCAPTCASSCASR